MLEALNAGAWVIANTGGDRSGYTGLFSNGGHYVTIRGIKDGKLMVCDPGYYPGKFDRPGRKGRVSITSDGICVLPEQLDEDCKNRSPKYYLFEEAEMTQEQFDKMMESYLAKRGEKGDSEWAKDAVEKAAATGISDGARPRAFATREEVMSMILRSGGGGTKDM